MIDKSRRRILIASVTAVSISATGCLGSSDDSPNEGGSDDSSTGGDDGSNEGDGDGSGPPETLPERGDEQYIQEVEPFESQGREHVSGEVDYERTPPLSGPHHSGVVDAGYYEQPQPTEELVHSLEHGAVVIYYDADAITEEARSDLRERANIHTGTWTSVIVVPSIQDEPEAPYTLTAWQHRLRIDEYDPEAVTAFLAEYLGRGPENPVR